MPFNLGMPELILFGMIALLLFGRKLPEVARSLGKGMVEFKRGMRGVEDEMHSAVYGNDDYSSTNSSSRPAPPEERVETTAPKFEPPTSAPH
jgi:sec-independent protein translocase protein TatA